ncbi:uncharacterized protein si:dkey-118j18.2 isoform X2 [Nothobranchius furzeri]|uniref:Transcript variant X2 n=1 Tax=Nothobranchius furzeri TaxID=105023 RepID=A0A9D3BMH3_NOTFU|nr:transcript variant X2 [Nothobranchius furzeri]
MELYWYIVIIFIVIKIFFYVCWYRSRQRQLAAYLTNTRNAEIVIVGGRAYLHQMCERQSTSVWPSWYGVQDDLSIEEPSTALPPTASYSHLEMPPPYEAVSGDDDLKPPPYSECARSDEADIPHPHHDTLLISGGANSVRIINEPPPPYTLTPPTPVAQQGEPVSPGEAVPESRAA